MKTRNADTVERHSTGSRKQQKIHTSTKIVQLIQDFDRVVKTKNTHTTPRLVITRAVDPAPISRTLRTMT